MALIDDINNGFNYLDKLISEFINTDNENFDSDQFSILNKIELLKSRALLSDVITDLNIDISDLVTKDKNRKLAITTLNNLGSDGGIARLGEGRNLYYADPFCKELYWVNCRGFTNYIYEYYSLNLSELINLINLRKEDHKITCPICNTELHPDRLSHGFPLFCSVSCSNEFYKDYKSELLKNQWMNPEFRSLVSNLSRERMIKNWDDEEFRAIVTSATYETFTSNLVKAKIHRSNFINRTPSKSKCYLYITRSLLERNTGLVKFGITSQDPNYYSYSKCYKNFHVILSGSPDLVANTEYEIKVKLNSGEWILESELNKLILTIKYIINDRTTKYDRGA